MVTHHVKCTPFLESLTLKPSISKNGKNYVLSNSPKTPVQFTELLSNSSTWFYIVKLNMSNSPNFSLINYLIISIINELMEFFF